MRFSLASTVVAVLGATLVMTRFISPAGSAPVQTTPPTSETGDAAVKAEREMPGVAEVNAELSRLQGRLDAPVAPPPAGRNPFDFGDRPERRRVALPPTIARPVFDTAPLAVTPKLVAILSDTIDERVVRTAVFSVNDDVQFMASGDDVTGFRVDAISGESVSLTERSSGRTVTLSLN
jgi:hypothetical protein